MLLNKFIHKIKGRWSNEGGYRQVLYIAFPLIISTGSWSVQNFVNRIFLTWYSPESIAATGPAGMLNFTIMSFFLGTATYVSTFVAQYYGAKRYNRIGPSMWQGIYVGAAAGLVHLLLIPCAGPFFKFIGHEPLLQENEVIYFQTLCLGAAPAISSAAMSCFFSARGRTSVVMWVNVASTAVNIIMDYALIFGNWGFPELGIRGAGIATVMSGCFNLLVYSVLIFRKRHAEYNVFKGWVFDRALAGRLVKFGVPNGIQFFLDMAGFTFFFLLMGRLGVVELAASNIALNINLLAFLPMIGMGMTVSILVGQHLGEDNPDMAEYCAYSGFHLAIFYIGLVITAYLTAPGFFISPFAVYAHDASYTDIYKIAVTLVRFVAVYSLFDVFNIIFASAIKGAGDTRFVMYMIVLCSLFVLIIPAYIAIVVLGEDVYAGWTIASVYICFMGVAFVTRFRGGKWKSMRVIESPAPPQMPDSGI